MGGHCIGLSSTLNPDKRSMVDDGHAACRAGIACIVPPEGWEPPFALERGTNGQSAESFKFMIRKQLTSHLCMRVANTGKATRRAPSRYSSHQC